MLSMLAGKMQGNHLLDQQMPWSWENMAWLLTWSQSPRLASKDAYLLPPSLCAIVMGGYSANSVYSTGGGAITGKCPPGQIELLGVCSERGPTR